MDTLEWFRKVCPRACIEFMKINACANIYICFIEKSPQMKKKRGAYLFIWQELNCYE